MPLHSDAREHERRFIHPGLLHSTDDLGRIRDKVVRGEEPWASAFERFASDRHSDDAWKLMGPRRLVVRDRRGSDGNPAMEGDARAAYQNALMWVVTEEEAHAEKSVEILNAWAETLKRIGGRDVQLAAGLNGFLLVNAAEIVRWTRPGWREEDIRTFEGMLLGTVYPPIRDFAPHANGNWDAACIKTMLAIGVFCDRPEIFDRAVEYYHNGRGNGRVTHYVINEVGQCQESGRDQQHTQLGLGCLAEACEIGWHQGVDMYGAADNRLMRGYEYTARYLLGNEVPFSRHIDTTGKYRHTKISEEGRHRFRPIYELPLNHYNGRLGLQATHTAEAVARTRPEGKPHRADHPGFGTLLFHMGPAIPQSKQ